MTSELFREGVRMVRVNWEGELEVGSWELEVGS